MPFGIGMDLTLESPTRIYSGGGKRRLLALAELAAVALATAATVGRGGLGEMEVTGEGVNQQRLQEGEAVWEFALSARR